MAKCLRKHASTSIFSPCGCSYSTWTWMLTSASVLHPLHLLTHLTCYTQQASIHRQKPTHHTEWSKKKEWPNGMWWPTAAGSSNPLTKQRPEEEGQEVVLRKWNKTRHNGNSINKNKTCMLYITNECHRKALGSTRLRVTVHEHFDTCHYVAHLWGKNDE